MGDQLKTWQCPCCKVVYTEAVTSCACAKMNNATPYPVYVPYVPYRIPDYANYPFWYSDPYGTRITSGDNTITLSCAVGGAN